MVSFSLPFTTSSCLLVGCIGTVSIRWGCDESKNKINKPHYTVKKPAINNRNKSNTYLY